MELWLTLHKMTAGRHFIWRLLTVIDRKVWKILRIETICDDKRKSNCEYFFTGFEPAEHYQKVIEILIENGADINAQNEHNHTALHLAAENGDA